jgi:hypothetical protein
MTGTDLRDARRAVFDIERRLLVLDPTDQAAINELKEKLRVAGQRVSPEIILDLRVEVLEQEAENTKRAMGGGKQVQPEPDRGRMKLMASSGNLKKIITDSAVLKRDGSGEIDPAATAIKKVMQAASPERTAALIGINLRRG